MSSLWGSGKTTEQDVPDAAVVDGAGVVHPVSSEYLVVRRQPATADERTRLLPASRTPGPGHPDGYLDPDDPAVSFWLSC